MKKSIFKKILLATLGVVLVSSLVACGSDKEEKTNDVAKDKEIIVGLDNTFVPMGFLDKDN